jgi:hypothetical protein
MPPCCGASFIEDFTMPVSSSSGSLITSFSFSSSSSSSCERSPSPSPDYPFRRSLGEKTFSASHPDHGELTITREGKWNPAADTIRFDVRHQPPEGFGVNFLVRACIVDKDSYLVGAPSLGYDDDLDPALHETGMDFVLHAFMAETGIELEMDTFVVGNVMQGGAMDRFCNELEMTSTWHGCYYYLPMATLRDNARECAAQKGWENFASKGEPEWLDR